MAIRQPIVSVLGHVDHGKTSLLDKIRGTAVASREAGAITQHIGATEVPLDTIYEVCGPLIQKREFKIPGLLFIDTPGHHSFTTLRARGGALSDLAILVIDINEGFKPQTTESLNILRQYKTPFIVAANKIDRIPGWRKHNNENFASTIQKQPEQAKDLLQEALYRLVGRLYDQTFSADRYDRVDDFQKNVAIVPTSAKTGEGIPDLLLVLIGLAQRFLEQQLERREGRGEGTILEVKEEKGLGTTIDVILYKGTIKKGDRIVLGTTGKPTVTKVKALLKPKPLDEIRDPKERFDYVNSVNAAAGIKISAQNLEGVLSGAPVIVANKELSEVINEVEKETRLSIRTEEEGIIIKGDAIGSLEALAFEADEAKIPIKSASIGDISRRDIIDAATISDPLKKVILGFNVKVLPEAFEESHGSDVIVITNNVIYKLLEDYEVWCEKKKRELEEERRGMMVYPGKIKVLPDCVFRVSKPAIVGVRVLAGRIRSKRSLLREDGRVVGKIKSIQTEGKSLKEAIAGEEVAISIENVTVGRQINVEDILYMDIPERDAKKLAESELNIDEQEILQKIFEIKRRESSFWGM